MVSSFRLGVDPVNRSVDSSEVSVFYADCLVVWVTVLLSLCLVVFFLALFFKVPLWGGGLCAFAVVVGWGRLPLWLCSLVALWCWFAVVDVSTGKELAVDTICARFYPHVGGAS